MFNNVTKHTQSVSVVLEEFLSEFVPEEHDIIAACVGPAPNQYDMWGKPTDLVKEWALHIHVNYSDTDRCKLPTSYNGIPILVFYNLEEM